MLPAIPREAAPLNPDARAYVFNAADLHERSLARTGNQDFPSLEQRTEAFSADNDFLTSMNETSDPRQQIENARLLRREMEGADRPVVAPWRG